MELQQTFSISNEAIADMVVIRYGESFLSDLRIGLKNFSFLLNEEIPCGYALNGQASQRKIRTAFLVCIDNNEEVLRFSIDKPLYVQYDKFLMVVEDEKTRDELAQTIKDRLLKLL